MKRMAIIFILFQIPIKIYGNNIKINDCKVSQYMFDKFMSQDFNTFDQTQDGWRSLFKLPYDDICYLRAANLIDSYILKNTDNTDISNKIVLYFHAGQNYAFLNMNDIALKRFAQSYNPNEPEDIKDSDFHWNDYVLATSFFLKKDMDGLLKEQEIFMQSTNPYDAANFNIVKNFIRHFDKNYRDAYFTND